MNGLNLDLVPRNNPVVVKIDIEGYECKVSKELIKYNGIKSVAKKRREIFVTELTPPPLLPLEL